MWQCGAYGSERPTSLQRTALSGSRDWPGGTLDEMLLNTSKPEGSGIGLYIVKTAVENHRGTITIGRSPLGGAEFRITLPITFAT
ncbi:MAG: ATP-binding protein [Chthoniobacterales bacterium]|nr:ATP-binding protein [Chthoniobacterales bacterium]